MPDMKPLKHLNNDILVAVVRYMEPIFDSGEYIEEVRRVAPVEYAKELADRIPMGDQLFQQLHADIASRLNFGPLDQIVESLGERRPATSIFGTPTRVMTWRKK